MFNDIVPFNDKGALSDQFSFERRYPGRLNVNAVVFILNEMDHRYVHNQEVAIFKSARSGLKLSDNCEGRDGHHFFYAKS
jgi:hypothetical protein